jgi:hypothetical protein
MFDFEVSFCLVFMVMGLLSAMGMPIRFNYCSTMDEVLQSISVLTIAHFFPPQNKKWNSSKTIPSNSSASTSPFPVPAQAQQQMSQRADKPRRTSYKRW